MANLTLPFKCFIFFFFLLMISHTPSSSSSSSHSSNNNQQIQPQDPSSTISQISHYHQVFYLKNANPNADPPTFLSRQERIKKRRMNRNKNKNKKHRKHRKKIVKNMMKSPPRPFSVMLPKGFVPPSGSSPCHNDQPNSMSFHCHLSSSEPWGIIYLKGVIFTIFIIYRYILIIHIQRKQVTLKECCGKKVPRWYCITSVLICINLLHWCMHLQKSVYFSLLT